jgi:hypothetical protein
MVVEPYFETANTLQTTSIHNTQQNTKGGTLFSYPNILSWSNFEHTTDYTGAGIA